MVAKDPELRSLIASKAVRTQYARMTPEQRRERTAKARETYLEQLRDEIDPDRRLDPADLDERVRQLRRIKLTEIAIKRVKRQQAAREAAELDELLSDDGAA